MNKQDLRYSYLGYFASQYAKKEGIDFDTLENMADGDSNLEREVLKDLINEGILEGIEVYEDEHLSKITQYKGKLKLTTKGIKEILNLFPDEKKEIIDDIKSDIENQKHKVVSLEDIINKENERISKLSKKEKVKEIKEKILLLFWDYNINIHNYNEGKILHSEIKSKIRKIVQHYYDGAISTLSKEAVNELKLEGYIQYKYEDKNSEIQISTLLTPKGIAHIKDEKAKKESELKDYIEKNNIKIPNEILKIQNTLADIYSKANTTQLQAAADMMKNSNIQAAMKALESIPVNHIMQNINKYYSPLYNESFLNNYDKLIDSINNSAKAISNNLNLDKKSLSEIMNDPPSNLFKELIKKQENKLENFKILNLSINNFKNLKKIFINFENNKNLTIIIGNNASGKSNILEAISAIFTEIYTRKRHINFKYELNYIINNSFISIVKNSTNPCFFVNGEKISKTQFLNSEYIPSKIIALYSGDETRLWEQYYAKFYKQYLKELGTGKYHTYSKNLLYIDKSYWNIAFLVLLISDLKDHKKYINEKLHVQSVEKIEFYFKPDKIESCINPILSQFIEKINPKHERKIVIELKKLKRILKNSVKTNIEIFELLIYANMPRINKIITNIKINFNNGLTLKMLSEGEKKRILIKTVLDLIANERSIVLLDEPDAHIHEIGKKDLYISLKQYTREEHRHVIMTTHSPSITCEAESCNIVMIDNIDNETKIIPTEKKENIQRLTGGDWTVLEQNIIINSTNPLILVEGKSDIKYIRKVLSQYEEYQDINWDFLSFGGTGNARDFIEELRKNISENKKVIVLFDRDEGGVNGLKNCISPHPSNGGKNDDTLYKDNNFYYLLLPKTKECSQRDTNFMIEDYFSKECINNYAKTFISTSNEVLKSYKGLDEKIKAKLMDDINSSDLCFDGFKTLISTIIDILSGKIKPIDINQNIT